MATALRGYAELEVVEGGIATQGSGHGTRCLLYAASMQVEPGHRRKLRRMDRPSEARFLTFSCFRRQPFLSRDRSREWLVDAIALAQARHEFDLWAWVIMPEHVHLLVYPDPDEPTVGSMLSTIKQSVAKKAVAWARKEDGLACMADVSPRGKVVHRFWQRGGGHDRNLWTPRRVWDVIEYIHRNPVERGLCERAEDWEWSSARGFGDGGQKLVLEHRYLPVRRG